MAELSGLNRNQLDRLAAAEIRKISRTPSNRLLSIEEDALVVRRVVERWPHLELVANLRCGAWYTPPALTAATSYFKSTDGHTSQWSFSLKRNNLHLLPLISRMGGIIVADSTRRGKRLPDALSKTIPIWCAVINLASSKKYGFQWDRAGLHTPPETVSSSEHAQIEAKLPVWADALLASDLEVPPLSKPLHPIFVTPASLDDLPDLNNMDFHPVVCLSVSRQTKGGMAYAHSSSVPGRTFVYMQGAGDDHENWALGLTPATWWDEVNHMELLKAEDEEMEHLIVSLAAQAQGNEWFVTTLAAQQEKDAPSGTEGSLTEMPLTLRRGSSLEDDWKQHPDAGLIIRVDGDDDLQEQLAEMSVSENPGRARRVLRLELPVGKRSLPKFNAALRRVLSRTETALVSGEVDLSANKGIVVSSLYPGSTHAAGAIYVLLLALLLNERRSPVVTRTLTDTKSTFSKDSSLDSDSGSEVDPVIDALAEHVTGLTKDSIRRRLQWMLSDPGLYAVVGSAGPARAWLNRVNEVLLSSQL